MSRNDRIYGIFNDSDDENQFNRKKKQKNEWNFSKQPVDFISSSASASELNKDSVTREDDEIDESKVQFSELIKTSTKSASNNDFKNMVEQKSAAATAAAQVKPPPPSKSLSSLGTWEKHTKGFGKKMMEKMGFKGRLGAKESGISSSIEVKVRPNQMGLGFGDFTESSSLETNKKVEAELRGKEYIPPSGKGKGSKSKGVVESRAASKAWKLGGVRVTEKDLEGSAQSGVGSVKAKPKKKGVRFDDVFTAQDEAETKQVILDMRGPMPKYITDTTDISHADVEDETPLLGQELLYNLNLVVDMEEMDLHSDERKLASIQERLSSLDADSSSLGRRLERDTEKMEALEKIQTVLGRMENTINSDAGSITREHVVQGFLKLTSLYSEECMLLGLVDIIPSFAKQIIERDVSQWDPMVEPMRVVGVYVDWMTSLSAFEATGGTEHSFAADSNESDLQHHLGGSSTVQPAYASLQSIMEGLCLPTLRRYLVNQWVVTDEEAAVNCAAMMKGMKGILSPDTFRGVVDMTILPKITAAVSSWNPTTDRTPIDKWVVPWVRVLGHSISSVFPEIRRKISKALGGWEATDHSAYWVLSPWIGVFDETSMSALLVRSVVPKLVNAMRAQSVEPRGQSTEHIASVMIWKDILPRDHLLAIIEGEFFPKWFHVLAFWLSSDPDFGEVSTWYTSWKGQFPDDVAAEPLVTHYFSSALDMMSAALSHSGGAAPSFQVPRELVEAGDYFKVMERRKLHAATAKRMEQLKRGDWTQNIPSNFNAASSNVTFREVVEEFAARNGVSFGPKLNSAGSVVTEDGKALWTFADKLSCYIDQNVVFVKQSRAGKGSAGGWRPVALDE
eukprot:CAMPEP_0185033934 /NCGR_PEP_ID=MMETSP1103-20130426/23360_1 /TAXON_ID=36769 /ORGANISM="Paraphysomonas bandaiensis, Strain Caron Lab Isolate" /LENGTH=847 /DNA_ID=CAMNT_0027570385 /DNA_START=61 /DNA_END=2601 /DNA_ORIENTATION=-